MKINLTELHEKAVRNVFLNVELLLNDGITAYTTLKRYGSIHCNGKYFTHHACFFVGISNDRMIDFRYF